MKYLVFLIIFVICFSSCIEKCGDNDFTLRMRIEYNLKDSLKLSVSSESKSVKRFSQEDNFSEYCFSDFPQEIIIELNNTEAKSFEIKSVLIESQAEQLFLDSNYLFHQHFIGNKNAKYYEAEDKYLLKPNSTIQFRSRPFLNNKLKQILKN